jgi:hypothetical protein
MLSLSIQSQRANVLARLTTDCLDAKTGPVDPLDIDELRTIGVCQSVVL